MDAHDLLPEFVRTPHLPGSRAGDDDVVAETHEATPVFTADDVWVEEKLDGANVGLSFLDGYPIMRNRRHVLNKGKVPKNPSGRQYIPIWNWMEKNKQKFKNLEGMSVYGEWLWMAQGIYYDRLPDYLIAFDIYDPQKGFLPPTESRPILHEAGFITPPLVHRGRIDGNTQLESWCVDSSPYATTSPREGIYLRVLNGRDWLRFKMVRHNFVPGEHWGETVVRNLLADTRQKRRRKV